MYDEKEDNADEIRSEHSEGAQDVDNKTASSSTAKLVIQMKKKREMMVQRLDAPIRAFFRNANIFTFLFALQMVAAPILSSLLILSTNDGRSCSRVGLLLTLRSSRGKRFRFVDFSTDSTAIQFEYSKNVLLCTSE